MSAEASPSPPDPPRHGQRRGPGRLAMLWWLVRLARNPATMYRDVRARYGDTVWLHDLRGRPWLFISRPEDIRRVHQANHRGYGRGRLNEPFTAFLGDGLLTSERDTWARHRRLMNPYFHGEHRAALLSAAGREIGALLAEWDGRCGGPAFNICPDLELFAYRVVAYSMFGLAAGDEATAVHALDSALQYVSRESFRLIDRPRWLPSPAQRRFRRHLAVLDRLLTPAIAAARSPAGERPPNLLSELLDERHALTDVEIRDEILTMLHAGQHTVASGLSFALHLVATHPAVAAELVQELAALNGADPTAAATAELPRLDAVIDETLRLYPPAWGGVRETIGPDQLDGVALPPGTPVVFSQFVTHRDPRHWQAADEFCPHRSDRAEAATDYRYFPFGGGPHLCIGKDIALVEMRLALAAILARFTLRPAPGRRVRPLAMLDLIPAGGVHLLLGHRTG